MIDRDSTWTAAFLKRFFASLVSLYPRDFRDRFGEAITADLEEGWRRRRSSAGRFRFLVTVAVDSVRSAAAERLSGRATGVSPAPPRSGATRLDLLTYELRRGVHRLLRHPGATVLAVLTLAIGLGCVTAVYSLVDGILLRPLPYPEPDRLVRIWSAHQDGEKRFLEASWPEVERFRGLDIFSGVAAFSVAPRDLADDAARPEGIELARVSEGLFEVLGVAPALGRSFTRREYADGAPVVVLDDGFWRLRYGGDPEVLGRRLSIQGSDHRVVGVMPPSFDLPHGVALWRPFTRQENLDEDRELVVLARLRDDVDMREAGARLEAALVDDAGEIEMTAWAQPLHAMLSRNVRSPLLLLLAAVGALMLLTCLNVAHLQLARLAGRRRELALRAAIGADSRRLAATVLIENLVLAVVAGGAGLFLGYGLLALTRRLAPADLPRLAEVGLDGRVAFAMAALTATVGLVAGWLPSRRSAETDPARDLRAAATGRLDRRRRWLVTGELGLATLLAATAGLMFTSLGERRSVDHGLELDHAVQVGVSPPNSADDLESRQRFYERLVRSVATVPGVRAAGAVNHSILAPGGFRLPLEVLAGSTPAPSTAERTPEAAGEAMRVVMRAVHGDWMQAAGMRLLAGRFFEETIDSRGGEGALIVDRAFVVQELGLSAPEHALGLRLQHPPFGTDVPRERRIVGVVETVRLEADLALSPRVYVPYRQFPWPRMKLLVRTAGHPETLLPALRARIWSIDDTVPIGAAETLQTAVDRQVEHQRFQSRLLGAFAHLAVLLAAVGLYAVLSAIITDRARDIAVRRALGAGRVQVVWEVLKEAVALVLPGLVFGLAGAALAGGVLARRLYGIEAIEPGVWLGVTALLLGVALAACFAPLLRALRLEPMRLLRGDQV